MDDVLCEAEQQLDQATLYWVGVGTSAGGMEALRELGRHLPENVLATYIVTQHMAPQHKSMMTELVGRAIGVILSGTGSDGAYGVQALRAAGGITIAQDEGTAKYDGMPNAAIETGCIDLVSCRNLLIYFRQSLQDRVMARFHYALTGAGLLLLGKSESISGSSTLFRTLGDDRRIFQQRTSIASPPLGTLDYQPPFRTRKSSGNAGDNERYGSDMAAMFDSLVRAVGPNCLLATPDLQLNRAYGDVGRYIALAEGDLKMTVMSLRKPAYAQEVRIMSPSPPSWSTRTWRSSAAALKHNAISGSKPGTSTTMSAPAACL